MIITEALGTSMPTFDHAGGQQHVGGPAGEGLHGGGLGRAGQLAVGQLHPQADELGAAQALVLCSRSRAAASDSLVQRSALADAEAVRLVEHHKPQRGEAHVRLVRVHRGCTGAAATPALNRAAGAWPRPCGKSLKRLQSAGLTMADDPRSAQGRGPGPL